MENKTPFVKGHREEAFWPFFIAMILTLGLAWLAYDAFHSRRYLRNTGRLERLLRSRSYEALIDLGRIDIALPNIYRYLLVVNGVEHILWVWTREASTVRVTLSEAGAGIDDPGSDLIGLFATGLTLKSRHRRIALLVAAQATQSRADRVRPSSTTHSDK